MQPGTLTHLVQFVHLNDLQKLLDFAYKSTRLDRVYLGDHKYMNIMLLWQFGSLKIYTYIYTQCYRQEFVA